MEQWVKDLDGRFGEAFAGDEFSNGSHINIVVASRGSSAYAEAIRTLANPSPGHVPFLACQGLGNVVRPATIVINKLPTDDEHYARFFYGAAQLGIAQGVSDALSEGVLDKKLAGEVAILVACWIDPEAKDETKIRIHTREAMHKAIINALTPVSEEYVEKQLARYETATNNFYQGR